jgi:hypothetical protein
MSLLRRYHRQFGVFAGTIMGTWHAHDEEVYPMQPLLSTGMIYSCGMLGFVWEMTVPLYGLYWTIRYARHRKMYPGLPFLKHTFIR